MTGQRLTSGQMAERFGVSARQLEHWRKIGLLAPSHRTAGGHSRYTQEDTRRAALICALLEQRFSLRAVRRVIDRLHEQVEQAVRAARAERAEELLSAKADGGIVCPHETPPDVFPRGTPKHEGGQDV